MSTSEWDIWINQLVHQGLGISTTREEENEEMESYLDTKKEDKSYWEQSESSKEEVML